MVFIAKLENVYLERLNKLYLIWGHVESLSKGDQIVYSVVRSVSHSLHPPFYPKSKHELCPRYGILTQLCPSKEELSLISFP